MSDDIEQKTGSDTYHVPKLTEENYRSWAQQLRWILDEKELLDIVDGTEPKPIPNRDPVEAAKPAVQAEFEKALSLWNRKMKKARSLIGASVSSSVMTYIEGMDDPAKMWEELENRYNPKSQATLLQVVREFMLAQKDDSINMEHHLQRVQRLKRQVEEQGEKISDTIYNSVLLNSVPDDYKITVSILESQDNLTPTIIINRLLEETRKIYANGSSGSDVRVALYTSLSGKSEKSGNDSKRNLKCTGCGKDGHVEADCWTKHPEKRPKKNGRKGKKEKDPKEGESEEKFAMSATLDKTDNLESSEKVNEWPVDSGASEHFSPFRQEFMNFKQFDKPCTITTAEGAAQGLGIGTINIAVMANENINILELQNVVYAPKMKSNLLSLTTLLDRGYEISMNPKTGVNILKDGVLVSNTVRKGKLFYLKTVQPYALKTTVAESVGEWHKKMAHLGEEDIRKLEGMSKGMKLLEGTKVGTCGPCLEGKQTRQPSHEPRERATEPLELVHSDTSGQITPTSLGGANAYVTFTDDATGMVFLEPIKNRSAKEMLRVFKEFKAMVENQLNKKIKRLRTDGGGEYAAALGRYLKKKGILHEKTAPYSPDQNGVSERMNRTIMERTKAVLADTNLPKILWMEIASTVAYLRNRSPTRAIKGKTPYEAWFGRKPSLSHIRIIGEKAYVHIAKERRKKLDFHSHESRLVGYGGTNQYRIWDPIRKDVIVSRDVEFEKEEFTKSATSDTISTKILQQIDESTVPIVNFDIDSDTSDSDDQGNAPINKEPIIYDEIVVQPAPVRAQAMARNQQPSENSNLIITGPRQGRGQPAQRYDQIDWNQSSQRFAKLAQINEIEPRTFTEAINHPIYGRQWYDAIKSEIQSLLKNKTWILTELPKGRQAISNKWTFKAKLDELGNIIRFKARLVARGFSQVFGVDYLDTFAPVAKLAAIRILLAIATVEDLEVHQMDVVTAFLIPDLKEEIYMQLPEGLLKMLEDELNLEMPSGDGEIVCKLEKGLYGLKQAARLWNLRLQKYLLSLGFKQSVCDPCIYINNKTGIIIAIWVDDLIVLGKDLDSINKIKAELRNEFEMKDLGELKYFLGMQVTRDRVQRRLHLSQEGYTREILNRFGMQDSKPVSTPIATGTALQKSISTDCLVDQKDYQRMVGSQMYSMLCTRPDTAYAVSQISQHNATPNTTHSSTAKRAFRYLNATSSMGITYSGSEGLKLKAYSDADFAASEGRKSTMAYVFILGNGAVSWMSKKERTVAVSTTEAEYMALLEAVKESIWIQRFLKELGRNVDDGDVIMEDNQGTIALSQNPEYHARTKHIDVQYHFVRECIEMGQIQLRYCPTEDMVADALTKP
ncbi:MAG: DDE-type integrase/transposase/recombinase, partial [Chloroflexi bacterium]